MISSYGEIDRRIYETGNKSKQLIMTTRITNCKLRTNKAFTLIELLTVVAVIALLISIVLPAFQKARWHANSIYCSANIKEQYISQIMYADDHNGNFATHNEGDANYARNWVCWPPTLYDFPSLFSAMKVYVKDPDIMICPLLRQFGEAFEDVKYIKSLSGNRTEGGWDTDASQYIYSAYCWFANLKDGRHDPPDVYEFSFMFDARFGNTSELVNEPPWPQNTQQCSSDRAFIAHKIIYRKFDNSMYLYDLSHGVTARPSGQAVNIDNETALIDEIMSIENPVGYADGHVKVHKKPQFRPRACSYLDEIYVY